MVGGGSSPGLVAIIIIVSRTFLVRFFYHFFRLFLSDGVQLHQSGDAGFFRGGDEDVHMAGMVAQDVVGTTADEDARLLLGQLANHIFQLRHAIERCDSDLLLMKMSEEEYTDTLKSIESAIRHLEGQYL